VRVVIDTNIFISALLIPTSSAAHLVSLWKEEDFILLTADLQLQEIIRVTRYPKLRERLTPSIVGRLINEIREISIFINKLTDVDVSDDPYDNYLLSIASAGQAHYLITGDKRDLLSLKKYNSTLIITLTDFLGLRKK
jgi:putative PIN family toxin of toxin-antitoxin system